MAEMGTELESGFGVKNLKASRSEPDAES